MNRQAADPAQLSSVERELARTRLRLRFRDPALERCYAAEQAESARLHNRITVCLMAVIFDAFILPEIRSVPEEVPLSAALRFAVFTPAVAAYVLLDWHGRITRWLAGVVTGLLVAPTIIAAIISLVIVSPSALPNYAAVPLVQLVVLTCRVSMRQAALINAVSCLVFVWTTVVVGFVPPSVAPSLIMTDLAIGIGTLVFAWRIDLRDRQVFLFTRQAAIGRDLLSAQNRRLARLTQVDALTGLGNRRCFDEAVAALWDGGRAGPAQVSLIMFDIDCFKQFNDALGHQAGDECLGAVARTAARCLRDERDTLVRYGGEEFAIILPDTGLEDGVAVAERMRLAIQERALPHPGGGPTGVVTVSLGVATVLPEMQSPAALVEAADQMLYAAKRHGRNRVESARPAVAPWAKLGVVQ